MRIPFFFINHAQVSLWSKAGQADSHTVLCKRDSDRNIHLWSITDHFKTVALAQNCKYHYLVCWLARTL